MMNQLISLLFQPWTIHHRNLFPSENLRFIFLQFRDKVFDTCHIKRERDPETEREVCYLFMNVEWISLANRAGLN